jgi:hypothetical protein
VRNNRVISGSAWGVNGTTGAWYANDPGSAPWSWEPITATAAATPAYTGISRPPDYRWPAAAAPWIGVDASVGTQDWSIAGVEQAELVGSQPAGITMHVPAGFLLAPDDDGGAVVGARPTTVRVTVPSGGIILAGAYLQGIGEIAPVVPTVSTGSIFVEPLLDGTQPADVTVTVPPTGVLTTTGASLVGPAPDAVPVTGPPATGVLHAEPVLRGLAMASAFVTVGGGMIYTGDGVSNFLPQVPLMVLAQSHPPKDEV